MKLAHIRVKDFRSFGGEHDFDAAGGANFFVGPNNCGKSNLVRALELALDPDARYEPAKDRPVKVNAVGAPPATRITLTFDVGTSQPEKTLLARARAYELAVRAMRRVPVNDRTQTYADEGQIRVVTTFTTKGVRQTTFQAKASGAAAMSADSDEHIKLEQQFRSVVRFAVIHSGEDLASLLQGKFREILQLVIQDHLGHELQQAETARERYLSSLQSQLLEPLRSKVLERVQGMFPEIRVASLVPDVPRVSDTLSSVDIQLGDLAVTQLLDKGTGVRGAVLVSMLQYMAEQSRRSLVLAVEEPEAFLHPAGQEHIGAHLLDLAARSDVSLVVTTHSPYVIAREPSTLVTELRKDADGVTRNAGSALGSDDRAERLGSLYRDGGMANVIERALKVPPGSRGVLITEGYTDGEFMRLACMAAGRGDLIEGIHIIPANGAGKVIVQAILARSATDLPVVALLDHDENGRTAQSQLENFGWSKKCEILSLLTWPGKCSKGHDVEIEDLLPSTLTTAVADRLGEIEAVDEKRRCGDRWHVAYSKAWKAAALEHMPALLKPEHTGHLVWLAEQVNDRLWKVNQAAASAASARGSVTVGAVVK